MVSVSRKVTLGLKFVNPIERRNSRRFPITLPVLFRWADGEEHYDVGHCGNIGSGGIFVFSTKCPPAGVEIDVELMLPAFDLVPHPVRLHCTGRVIRVEACYHLSGFAVAGQFEDDALIRTAVAISA
jgi:hypothetical protein